MSLPCAWCGDHRRTLQVLREGRPVRSPIPGIPLFLCPRCWGVYRETGERLGAPRHRPDRGPITGVPLTPERLRTMRG